VAARELAAFAKGDVLAELLEQLPGEYGVASDGHAVAFVPPFARFPYEVWVAPRRPHPGP
jgi:UDPglucose--hexose-1-phosphate uridylyltransferase